MSDGNTWEIDKRAQLARLEETLDDVLSVLRLDQQCEWTAQFEELIRATREIAATGFAQADLNAFSRSMCSSLASFRAYRPPASLPAEGLHGTDNFETFTRAAWQQAFQLRVISGPMWRAPTQFR